MIIGLTCRKHIYEKQSKYYINESYIKLLRNNNITPLLLNIDNYKKLINLCDGVIITGGYDINPYLYNQDNINSQYVDQENDLLDLNILNYCDKNGLPCLGICRGLQIINVFYNGTLFQDINKIHHNNLNAELLINNNKYKINSYHHQGIDKLGDNLISLGKSEGLIEYIKHNNKPIIGVQFHIEKEDYPINKIIFLEFINLVNNYL